MLVIGEAVVEQEVATAVFCCDVAACKGACCTLEGGRGAPLQEEEAEEIALAWPHVRPLLDAGALGAIATKGLVEGPPGDATTPCVGDGACVYVVVQDGAARCAFEQVYLEGLTRWRKPLSCHLFPIRLRRTGRDHLRYEQIHECAAGRRRGEAERVPLHAFLRDPLTRVYGERWYAEFLSRCAAASGAPAGETRPC